MKCSYIVFFLFICSCTKPAVTYVRAPRTQGKIVTSDGTPVEHAKVYWSAEFNVFSSTTANGQFDIPEIKDTPTDPAYQRPFQYGILVVKADGYETKFIGSDRDLKLIQIQKEKEIEPDR